MKVVAIIQARMGSSRLPGKVLKQVMDKPLLEHQLDRIKSTKLLDEIVIATTTNDLDLPIIEFCKKQLISYYRGSEEDVLSRYYETARKYEADIIVRLTSDCPLIDPKIIDRLIHKYKKNEKEYDYISNTLKRTFPRGMDVEVFSLKALSKANELSEKRTDREHVTPFIYNNSDLFNLEQVINEVDLSEYRLTVDTKEDFNLIKKLLIENNQYSLNSVIEEFKKNPDLMKINQHIIQKKV